MATAGLVVALITSTILMLQNGVTLAASIKALGKSPATATRTLRSHYHTQSCWKYCVRISGGVQFKQPDWKDAQAAPVPFEWDMAWLREMPYGTVDCDNADGNPKLCTVEADE